MNMNRTFLIVIAATITLLGVGVLSYLYFFYKPATLTTTPGALLPGSADSRAGAPSANSADVGIPIAGAGTEVAPHLIRISDVPVVYGTGVTLVQNSASTTQAQVGSSTAATPDVSVSYIEKESGNIFDFRAHARTLTRVSNKTLPGLEDALWAPDASMAFVRFLDHSGGGEVVSTYALPRTGEGGYTLPRGIAAMLVMGNNSLLSLTSTTEGSVATLSTFLGTTPKTLFSSPLSRLSLSAGSTTLVATTKASAALDGYAFLVNQKSGSFTRLLGPLKGLTTRVSPSGRYVLYTYLSGKALTLAVFDTKDGSALRLPLGTLTEKCAWTADSTALYCAVPTSLSGTLPDDWYQGAVSTSDRLWRIDLSGRVATQVADPKTLGAGTFDAVNLAVDAQNDVLVFTNRLDGTLWEYDL